MKYITFITAVISILSCNKLQDRNERFGIKYKFEIDNNEIRLYFINSDTVDYYLISNTLFKKDLFRETDVIYNYTEQLQARILESENITNPLKYGHLYDLGTFKKYDDRTINFNKRFINMIKEDFVDYGLLDLSKFNQLISKDSKFIGKAVMEVFAVGDTITEKILFYKRVREKGKYRLLVAYNGLEIKDQITNFNYPATNVCQITGIKSNSMFTLEYPKVLEDLRRMDLKFKTEPLEFDINEDRGDIIVTKMPSGNVIMY